MFVFSFRLSCLFVSVPCLKLAWWAQMDIRWHKTGIAGKLPQANLQLSSIWIFLQFSRAALVELIWEIRKALTTNCHLGEVVFLVTTPLLRINDFQDLSGSGKGLITLCVTWLVIHVVRRYTPFKAWLFTVLSMMFNVTVFLSWKWWGTEHPFMDVYYVNGKRQENTVWRT